MPQRKNSTIAVLLLTAAASQEALSQTRAVVEQERRDFAEWLRTAPLSPRRAVGVFPLGPGLSLGPGNADIPLTGVASARLEERDGRLALRRGSSSTPVARGRAFALGKWQLLAGGPAGRTTVTVFGTELRTGKEPAWFSYDPRSQQTVELVPARTPGTLRVLALDGIEVEATEAGTVSFVLAGKQRSLRVLRLPGASEEENELMIYFRDAGSGHGSYPAGRFVALIPQAGSRYLLDFNRARNPFCAYNTAYPCPAPWSGNALDAPVQSGERYDGGGLEKPPGN